MDIIDKQNFQPTNEVLRKWLETRKVDFHSIAGNRFKPFFTDSGVKEDRFWFRLAMTIELAGLLATIYGGLKSGGIFALIAIFIVFGLVILDLVVAKLIHKNEGQLVFFRAEAEQTGFFNPSNKTAFQTILKEKEKKDKTTKIIWLIVLIIMALFKLAAIFLLGTFNEPVIYYIFFALYMVVVYVHYKHTGYYMAYSGLFGIVKGVTNLMNKEHKIYSIAKTQGDSETINNYAPKKHSDVFYTQEPLDNIPIEHKMGHKIVSVDISESTSKGKHKYNFIAHGVLTDQEIIDMTNGQDDKNITNIFMTGRKLQLGRYSVGTTSNNNNSN